MKVAVKIQIIKRNNDSNKLAVHLLISDIY